MKPSILAAWLVPLGLMVQESPAGARPESPGLQDQRGTPCPRALATRILEFSTLVPAPPQPAAPGYADRLATTPLGPSLIHL